MEQDNSQETELIEQYLNGALKGDALASFEERVKRDKSFAQEVAIMRSMMDAVEMSGEEKLKDILKGVEQKLDKASFFKETEPKVVKMEPKKRFNWLALAASIAALVVALVWFNQDGQPTPEEAYAKFYKKEVKILGETLDDLEVFGMGDPNKSQKDQLSAALKLIETDNYQVAVDSLEEYLALHNPDPTASYYLGNAYMNLSKYGKAIEVLSPLIKLTDFKLLDWSKYDLALSYSMLETTEGMRNAITLMKQLTTSSNEEVAQLAQSWLDFMGYD